ncbi:anti-sigma-28 factor, FlgM family [Andreprevotia lacus DSM 23236]|jgi:negative regulator of flagellin synthesis FlgM|uniref:Negative regulator of flagellin synthesis n=1 Tax=Andreprevotia lacus DSM 23236 TaxID=1121001 RepID=A0A1W1X9J5_9NEIS|nr:flagellar biosynthesis anti-sigma factor FlgM [Andreprevotia lacus]SMC20559.1 anti-sigma-28 factor, FlgM family [Andreprevotia lacus DSM 23236]
MKIDQAGKTISQPLGRSGERTVVGKRSEASSSDDSVTINPAAAQLAGAEGGSGQVFDSERVQSLRQAIADGRFTVRTDVIADRLIDSVKEFLGK